MEETLGTDAGPRRRNKFTVVKKKMKKVTVYARKHCKYKTKAGLVALKKAVQPILPLNNIRSNKQNKCRTRAISNTYSIHAKQQLGKVRRQGSEHE